MRSQLLTQSDWQNLAGMVSADDVSVRLNQMGLITSSLNNDISLVEKELRENNVASAEALLHFSQDPARDAIRFFIYYYDLMNIEAVIHHLHAGADKHDISSVLYATGGQGMIGREILASVTSFAMLSNVLHGTVIYNAFKVALARFEQDEDVSVFIAAIEFEFMKNWAKAVAACGHGFGSGSRHGGSSFDAFIRVKATDAVFRMRFKRESQTHDFTSWAALVPGAPLNGVMSKWLEVSDEKDAFEFLVNVMFPGNMVKGAVMGPDMDLNVADRHLMRMLRAVARRSQRRNGFDADFLMSFLFLMMLQAEDLVSLLECKDFGLEQNSIAGYLSGVL
jgi:hypothetical protein